MGRTNRKGKEPASGSGEREFVYGIRPGEDFTKWPEKPKDRKKSTPSLTEEARERHSESHKWLTWPGATPEEKTIFTNKLASLQMRQVEPPRLMSILVLDDLGIKDEIADMLRTEFVCEDGTVVKYDMWNRIFSLNEDSIREWCLEFYSTLQVELDWTEEEFDWRKVIHFRLGGKQRHCTIPEFAYLTGMLKKKELASQHAYEFLKHGVWKTTGFSDERGYESYWESISGQPEHHSSSSKIKDCRIPVLRVLHKMITYGFLHRSNHNEKVYPDDLFLMRLFSEGSPGTYACAPMVLARYMSKHNDKKLVCGNFIANIVRKLKCDGDLANGKNGPAHGYGVIGLGDLRKSHLLTADDKLIPEGQLPPNVRPVRRRRRDGHHGPEPSFPSSTFSSFDFSGWGAQLGQIGQVLANQNSYMEHQRMMDSKLDRVMYHQDYYQPFLQRWASHEAELAHQQLPPYTPPPVYTPAHVSYDYYRPPSVYYQGGLPMQFGTPIPDVGVSGSGAGGSGSPDRSGAGFFVEPSLGGDGDGVKSVFNPPDMME